MTSPTGDHHIQIFQELTEKLNQVTNSLNNLRLKTIKLDQKVTKIAIAIIGAFFLGYVAGALLTQADCQNMQ